MTTEWVRAYSRKFQEVGLLYDYDILDRQRLLRVRINNDETFPTPVTPIYQARFTLERPVRSIPKRANEHEPREVRLCYRNPNNISGRTIRTVFNPYKPNTLEHRQIIVELKQGSFGFETVNYKGEVYNSNYEDLLN